MLIDFLTDVVSHMANFKDDLTIIYIFEENGRIVASSNHSKMMLLYRIVSNEDLSNELVAPMCCGALPYLNSLLGSALMKGGNLQVEYQEKDNKKVCANSMRFLSGRIDAHFECTNPEILTSDNNPSERRTRFDQPINSTIFLFTKEMRKQFDEVARMNTPKSDARMFNLVFDGNYIRAIFGSGKHTTSLILTDQITGNTEMKIQKLVSLERFKPMIRLVAENNGQMSFHEKSVHVNFDTGISSHLIVTPTIRQQN